MDENVALGTVEPLQVKPTVFDYLPAREYPILQPRICNAHIHGEQGMLVAYVSNLNGLVIPQEALKADSFACLLGLEESTSHRLHFEGHEVDSVQAIPIHDISPSCR